MHYAIIIHFDIETEAKIMRLMDKIVDNHIRNKFLEWQISPHVSLGIFNDVDEDRCTKLVKKFAREHEAFPAFLDSVGMFNDTKTVFLAPTMTRRLYDLHSELHAIMKEFDATGWEWYQPDGWVPHCTLAMTSEDGKDAFYQVSNLILREFEKMKGLYVSISLVKITCPAEKVISFDFEK